MFDLKAHLKSLVEAHAPSGHEAPIREIIRAAWQPLCDEMQGDRLGSLIGIKNGQPAAGSPRRKIMLAAHMDEIGLMVRDIVDGFIYVHRVSGIDNRVMLAQPVLVHGKRPLPGVVASVPPHLLTADMRSKYPTLEELIVDVGLPAADVNALVQIGDLITPDVPMIDLLGKRVAAKAFDNRALVAAVTACLNHLQNLKHQWDVYAVATVQEETGLRGAAVAAHQIQPDVAVALDVTFAPQPGVNGDVTNEMGGGPGIGVGPNFHPKLFDKIKEVAQANEIKTQNDIIPGASGTDAWMIQVALEGIPTALLEVPLRNMHSPVETIDLRDVERVGRLLALFIASLDSDFLQAIEYKTNQKAQS
ncbi:MAG: M20/M25/M40 family metallo-hydrolase [Chloroflexi bacterium]|nr:M20/M25/M40 family metallo-hydrolase [Chloroflexota bacterium]